MAGPILESTCRLAGELQYPLNMNIHEAPLSTQHPAQTQPTDDEEIKK